MIRPMASLSNTERYQPRITPVPDRLLGKMALVTGSARGIGRAIAMRLAQEGAGVTVVDCDVAAANETAADLAALGARAAAVKADVSDYHAVARMVDAAVEQMGAIDILVNNAGIIVFGSLMECRREDWDRMMAVDLAGAFYCTQAVGRRMIAQGSGGRMIHIGSTASLLPTPHQAAYCIAKAGLRMLNSMAALELVGYGITSNLLCPEGAITDINRELLADPAVMAQLESHIPAGRLAHVEEIAAAVAFLASDEAAYITGAELVHDGGASIKSLWWR